MSAYLSLNRFPVALGVLGLSFAFAVPVIAAPSPKPACSTNGPVLMTPVSPGQYSYTQGEVDTQVFSFTVSSPAVMINGSCNGSLPSVFGNGNGADPDAYTLPLTISIGAIEQNGDAVDAATEAALRTALSAFATAPFRLTPPGSDTKQEISFSFSNSAAVPVGTYDVTVDVKPEEGVGVGAASESFTIQVEEPQVVDTMAPTVNIVAPATGSTLKLNAALPIEFTAVDPPEGGAGTGVGAVRAAIHSCNGFFTYDLTSSLLANPAPPVDAATEVTATSSVDPWLYVGSFALTAEADDRAGHTGSATATFTTGTNVAPLPPISVPNRQFKAGSTLPIKFVITDAVGALLPPMDGLIVRITAPSGTVEERVAGPGAANVRWEVDAYGSVTQYITNYVIPVTGTYHVDILVGDVCGSPALQGGFDFVAATKGGK